ASNAEISFSSFAWTVYHTSHDCDGKRSIYTSQALFDLFRHLYQIYLASAAGRTGDEVHPVLPQVKRLQDLEADSHLIDRITGKRNPQSVADSAGQEDPEADSRLDCSGKGRARLGDA